MAFPYSITDRHNTKIILWNLLEYLQINCNLIILEESKILCAEELSDRHAFAIFYRINGGTDIVIGKFHHVQVMDNKVTSQMDDDSMYGIMNNKGIIVMILGNDMNVIPHIPYIQHHFSVNFSPRTPNQWTHELITKKTVTDSVNTLLKSYDIQDTEFPCKRTRNFINGHRGYIIFSTKGQFSMDVSVDKFPINDGVTDLALLQQTLLNPPNPLKVPKFAIAYDDQEINGNLTCYVLDSKNDFLPVKVEPRCNSLLRRLDAQAAWRTSMVSFQ